MKFGKVLSTLCFCLAVVLCLLALPAQAEAIVIDSGTCGDNLTWTLDDAGILTISGTGDMTDWDRKESPWYYNQNIKTVVLEHGVTSIGWWSFFNCTEMASVTIPDSVTCIDIGAFIGCSALQSVTIPDSVTSIDTYAFSGCSVLSDVIMGNAVTSIGDYAFSGCGSLTALVLPDSVTSIGEWAFDHCTSLKSINIPNKVTVIGAQAFWGCTSMHEITIGNGVTIIDDNAFYNCKILSTVYYAGTEAQWNAISVGSNNKYLTSANILYNHVHDYTAFPPVRHEPSCTEPGYIEYTCVHSDTYRKVLPILDHNIATTPAVAPTCTQIGLTEGAKCENCDYVEVTQTEVAATGHSFVDNICTICGQPAGKPGDLDGNEEVSTDDAVALLLHISMPDMFPIEAEADFDGDGNITTDDAIQLLLHISMPDLFPLKSGKKEN